MKERNPVLDEALRLQSMGISVIPIGKAKKPALPKWKKFQSTPADDLQIRDWFDCRDDLGLGIILGPVSGNLAARDFDDRRSFRRWSKANSDLAEKLPMAQSSHGFHVYGRISGCSTNAFGDGELRAHGSYIVVPPSFHPDGRMYRWIRGFNTLDDVPFLTVEQSGFGREWLKDSPKIRVKKANLRAITTDRTEIDSVVSVLSVEESTRLIEGTLPQRFGTRRKSLFKLARIIRSESKLGNIPLSELKPTIRLWHQRALPTIRTKDFDETWADFVDAHGNVDLSRCADRVVEAMKRALDRQLPQCAMEYECDVTRRLIGVCAELSRSAPEGIFFLSCRKGAAALGMTDFSLVSRLLKMLCVDKVLLETTHGGPETNLASRYLFLRELSDVPR